MTEENLFERAVTRGHAMLLLSHYEALAPASNSVFHVEALPVSWTLTHCDGVVLRLEAEPTANGVAIVTKDFRPGGWEENFVKWAYQAIADHAVWKLRRVLIDEVAAELAAAAVPFAGEDEYDPDLDHHQDRQAQLP